jgi:transposase-like protein
MPHSVWTLDARLKALELYASLRTNYRSAANALGVAPSTLYHWLDQFGAEPCKSPLCSDWCEVQGWWG